MACSCPPTRACWTSCGIQTTRSIAQISSSPRGKTTLAGTPPDLKVLAFDVFGTVVDWRSGVIAELTAIARERNLAVDAAAVADAWRKRYQPFLDRVCRGEAPWQVLDELHRAGLVQVVREFALEQLSEADLDRLVLAWHHLPPWPDAVRGLSRLRPRFVLATLSNGGMALLLAFIMVVLILRRRNAAAQGRKAAAKDVSQEPGD